jgi:hypothetical protein
LITLALVVCVLATGAVSASAVLPIPVQLPRTALLALALLTVTLPILVSSWRLSLVVLFAWFILEDLIRKLAGNDMAVYFMKDAFYVVFLVGFALDPTVKASWRSAAGSVRVAIYLMIGWALLMSIPALLVDWRLPLAGLRLDFLYVPLVAAGFLLVRDPVRLSRTMLALAIVGGVSCAIGCIQAIVGPSFLAPQVATPGLTLDLVRGLPGEAVYRPTGTFVDPGRFDSMAVVTIVIGLISVTTVRASARIVVAACLISAMLAVWVSGGRTYLIWGAVLIAAAVLPSLARADAAGRRQRRLWVLGVVVALVGVAAMTVMLPDVYGGRASWYTATLDPRSADNEWGFRWTIYSVDVIRGFELGGLIGQGTGQESLGKQYLFGAEESKAGLYQVEGGYASVIVEWGIIGVLLWLGWTVAWMVRQVRAAGLTRHSPLPTVGPVVVVWTAFFLFIGFVVGYQVFQNYIANAYFWLFSGLLFGAATVAGENAINGAEEPLLAA